MKKQVLLSSFLLLAVITTCSCVYAADTSAVKKEVSKTVASQERRMPPPECKKGDFHQFEHFKGRPGMPPFLSREEMEAKKAEIDKRLALTDEQKQKLEMNKEKDKAKIIPIIEKIKAKKAELDEINVNTTLTPEQKDKKADAVRKELKALRIQADNCRKQNMKNFESILTKEQKAEFEKIKAEQREEMKKRRAEFENMRKEFKGKYPPFGAHTEPLPAGE